MRFTCSPFIIEMSIARASHVETCSVKLQSLWLLVDEHSSTTLSAPWSNTSATQTNALPADLPLLYWITNHYERCFSRLAQTGADDEPLVYNFIAEIEWASSG